MFEVIGLIIVKVSDRIIISIHIIYYIGKYCWGTFRVFIQGAMNGDCPLPSLPITNNIILMALGNLGTPKSQNYPRVLQLMLI